jgi:hypothetical protein
MRTGDFLPSAPGASLTSWAPCAEADSALGLKALDAVNPGSAPIRNHRCSASTHRPIHRSAGQRGAISDLE